MVKPIRRCFRILFLGILIIALLIGVPATPVKAKTAEDQNYILVEKTFAGIPRELIPDGFCVTVSSDTAYILNKENTVSQTTDDAGNTVWRWKISGVGIGTYTVRETGEDVANYSVEKLGEETVEVKAADIAVEIPVHETTCSHTNWSVATQGDDNILFAATLTQGGVAVISKAPLSASQRAAVSAAVLKIKGPWKNPVYFYSVEEQMQNKSGFELNGATVTYDEARKEVIIGRTSNWQHVATVKYSVTEADDPEIKLKNVYRRSAADVTVRKTVIGNMADRDKSFDFTVSVRSDGSDAPFEINGTAYNGSALFSLKDGESVLLENIPVGARVTVTEADCASLRYEASYAVDGAEPVAGNAATVQSVTEGGHTVDFVNRKDYFPDTGIWLDTAPYILILGAVFVGSVTAFILRRKREGE